MNAKRVCLDCGIAGIPKSFTPGYFVIEIFLWLMFALPGLIYTVWRLSARRNVCAACGGSHLVPESSPAAQAMLSRFAPPAVHP